MIRLSKGIPGVISLPNMLIIEPGVYSDLVSLRLFPEGDTGVTPGLPIEPLSCPNLPCYIRKIKI